MNRENRESDNFYFITVGVEEAARMVSLSRRYLYNQMQLGRLPSVKAGRRRMIAVDDLYAWALSLKDKQTWSSKSAIEKSKSEK
jgi:excisionase family DNA binding protein